MDEEEVDGIKSPIKRLGSTRKLLVFNSEFCLLCLITLVSIFFFFNFCGQASCYYYSEKEAEIICWYCAVYRHVDKPSEIKFFII